MIWVLALLSALLLAAALWAELAEPPSERRWRKADALYLTAIIIAVSIIFLGS